jgi:hypothetical protein
VPTWTRTSPTAPRRWSRSDSTPLEPVGQYIDDSVAGLDAALLDVATALLG